MKRFYLIAFSWFAFLTPVQLFSQCGPNTPVVTVDLTGNPDSVWISPVITRSDNCCGTTPPDRCVKFIITLDPAAAGISFNIASGAVPPGALFYQVNCGPPTPVGDVICLSGPGPHIITFCKPGNNPNTYSITSVPAATAGLDIVINDGCTGSLSVTGLIDSTVTWTSVFPGITGQYDNYLSCTSGCSSTQVQAQAGYPPFVDYLICGAPIAQCNFQTICDTVRVTFNPTLYVNILPVNPTVCFGQSNTTITATGSGGTPPYNYQWNTGALTSSITVGAGTYSVVMGDASGCPPTSTSITVTAFANPITANAGSDVSVCGTNPDVTLSGSVTGTTTGIWSGGGGTFSPANTTLNAVYTPTASEIAAGSVLLILTTTNNGTCPPDSDSVVINYTQFTAAISTNPVNVSCYGGNNGSASVSVTGPGSPFSFSWNTSPAQTTSSITGLTAGNYIVTVTDTYGCTGTDTALVTQPFPLVTAIQGTDILCSGTNTGSASIAVSGGTPGYSYLWSPGGATSSSVSNLFAGTYVVSVTDINSCTASDTITITEPPLLTTTVSGNDVSCAGGSDGSVAVAASGGTAPYSYLWSPGGATSSIANGLPAGTYTVVVTDANGCSANNFVTITEPAPLVVSVTSNNETCPASNNGSATSAVSGGTPGYTYLWQPSGGTGSSASLLPAGNYTLTTTDANGCFVITPFVITEPPPLTISFVNIANVSCFGGADGSATASVNGGTPGYTYSWQPSGITTVTASGLSAGTQSITVTDVNGCVLVSSVFISQPATALNVTASPTAASCNGTADGMAVASSSGGTSPYSYFWSGVNIANDTLSNVYAGAYSVTSTDANGCTDSVVVTITEPSLIVLTTSSVNSTCSMANGQASVSASGGTPGYTYLWSPSGGTGATETGLLSGSYNVVVTDAAGCSQQAGVLVNDNSGPSVTIISVTNVSCYGGNDGSATAGISGGAGPFIINWTPYGGNGLTASGLIAGSYTVTVTDTNGCQSLATTSPVITEPSPISIYLSGTDVNCFGGSDGTISSTISGGTPGYTYSWMPGGFTTPSVSGLTVGTYTLTVTDANGCQEQASYTINQPTPLLLNQGTITNISCFGGNNGTASVSASGGTPGYIYQWLPFGSASSSANNLTAGNYTVNVVDAEGCVASVSFNITQPANGVTATITTTSVSCTGGSDGTATVNPSGGTPGYTYLWSPVVSSAQTATGLSAGNYSVTVTDAAGCNAVFTTTVAQPYPLTVNVFVQNATCGNANGTVSALVSGGTGPYTYLWSPGGQTTSFISGVAPGNYSVQVTDSRGCISSAGATVNNIPGPVAQISVSIDASCYGMADGSALAAPSGGTAPYQYLWLPYGTTSSLAQNLSAGVYQAIITDANGCSDTVSVTISQPPQLNAAIASIDHVNCFGGSDGSVTAAVSGGTSPYTYSWSPFGGTGITASGLPVGNYSVTVTDANGCTNVATGQVTQPTPLSISIQSLTYPSCTGYANGSSTAAASGGTAPYNYTWSSVPVQFTATAVGLPAGTYTVTATDINGCNINTTATLIDPAPVVTVVTPGDTICPGQSTTLVATGSGGSGSYFYIWNPVTSTTSGTQTFTPPASTTYAVTAYDMNGCAGNTDSAFVLVYDLSPGSVYVGGTTPICPGTGSLIFAAVSGNPGNITYTWNNGLGPGPGGFMVFPVVPTTYVCTVTNSCGISVSDSVTVDFIPPPGVFIGSDVVSGCVPLTVNFSDMSQVVPIDSVYSWSWDFGNGDSSIAETPVYIYTVPGSYNVILSVVTWAGCVSNSSGSNYIISVYPNPVADFILNSNTFMLPFETMVTDNTSQGAVNYQWDFGDGTTSTQFEPVHLYSNIGTYTVQLIAINQYGCTDTTQQEVTATSDITFPNAFTPDPDSPNGGTYSYSDLSNNVFFPYTAGVDEFHMQIFNRWGELIFETFDINIGWDGYYRGKLCQLGVYVWKADVGFIDGRKFSVAGDVTLLR